MKKLIGMISMVFLISGCTSGPKKTDGLGKVVATKPNRSSGLWEAKGYLEDKENQRRQVFNAQFVTRNNQEIRGEIFAPIGLHIASFLVAPKRIQAALHQEERWFEAPNNEKSLRSVIAIEFPWKDFAKLFDDQTPEGPGWRCEYDDSKLPNKCVRESDQAQMIWRDRQGDQKRIVFVKEQKELHILLKSFSPKVQDWSVMEGVESPPGYKRSIFR